MEELKQELVIKKEHISTFGVLSDDGVFQETGYYVFDFNDMKWKIELQNEYGEILLIPKEDD